ncbi:hypothetical protein I3900191A7_22850 [Clostridium baratii]|uniref:hypothetical protein n=1 Tax=Clostridium baratii TaxID=1561 RepID=UPI0036F42199
MRVNINQYDSNVVKILKEKLNKVNGSTIIKLKSNKDCDIRFSKNGDGIISSKIPGDDTMRWEVFDAVIELLNKSGGKALKGNARSGKLGNPKFTIDTVEGYIAFKAYGKQEGESSFGPGFVIYAILEWAGICENGRGYIRLNND